MDLTKDEKREALTEALALVDRAADLLRQLRDPLLDAEVSRTRQSIQSALDAANAACDFCATQQALDGLCGLCRECHAFLEAEAREREDEDDD